MNRVPTLFTVENRRLTSEPYNSVSKRILAGNAGYIPRRKWDGVAALCDAEGCWWLRQEVNSDRRQPTVFVETGASKQLDNSGRPCRRWGWVPATESQHHEALRKALLYNRARIMPGSTYELCGPRLLPHGNGEGFAVPTLIRHEDSDVCIAIQGQQLTYESLREFFQGTLARCGWEGIVWHGPQPTMRGGMMKLRVVDFG